MRLELILLVERDERDGVALHARPSGAADAVHVVLGVVGELEVDDHRQPLDVQAARRHVRGHQHAHLARLELLQGALALALGAVAVDGGGVHAVTVELSRPGGAVICLVRVKTSTWCRSRLRTRYASSSRLRSASTR